MTEDARFEDGGEKPLRLKAMDADDLTVLSALIQDSVFPAKEMVWKQKERRFAILLNRFRWEDVNAAKLRRRPVERVQSVLVIEDVLAVQSQGVTKSDGEIVLSLLSIAFEPGEDGMGHVLITFAGDGQLRISVEALEVIVKDVTRPYVAPSRSVPTHEN